MILCYQAYGRMDVVKQTLFSVVSLLRFLPENSPLRVVIYTDMRTVLEKFFGGDKRVELVEISAGDLQRWRGAIDFVHRVKLEVLLDCATRFGGSLFYADGDTYFKNSPLELFARVNDRTSLMHVAENVIAETRDTLGKKIAKFIRKNAFKLSDETVQMPRSTVMWNAGVIGVSEKNRAWFGKMIELTDVMHTLYKKHVMEQLAVSYVLQRETTVLPSDNVIYHYWDQKPEYQIAVDQFLDVNLNVNDALKNYVTFKFPKAPEPKMPKRGIFDFLFRRSEV